MNIPVFGTALNFSKMNWMQMKAQQNIRSGFVQSPAEQEKAAQKSATTQKTETILNKLKWGQEVSSSELEFLRQNSYEGYLKALRVQAERKQYRRELEACKTKDEVARLRTNRLQAFVCEAQGVTGMKLNAGERLERLEEIQMRAAAVCNEQQKFMNTQQYRRLPWENEKKAKQAPKTQQKRRKAKLAAGEKLPHRLQSKGCRTKPAAYACSYRDKCKHPHNLDESA